MTAGLSTNRSMKYSVAGSSKSDVEQNQEVRTSVHNTPEPPRLNSSIVGDYIVEECSGSEGESDMAAGITSFRPTPIPEEGNVTIDYNRPSLRRLVSTDVMASTSDQSTNSCFVSGGEEDEVSAAEDTYDDSVNNYSSFDEKRRVSVVDEPPSGSSVPVRCVSGANLSNGEGMSLSSDDVKVTAKRGEVPALPIPFHDSKRLSAHIRALRIEADISPMKQLLARLMTHTAHNRRNLFNKPVDPVALQLPNYDTIIKTPMDLGTVKARLHAVAYSCRDDVANDIRLTFQNAMTYNPPTNAVHHAAQSLLAIFEEAYATLQEKIARRQPAAGLLNNNEKVLQGHNITTAEKPFASNATSAATGPDAVSTPDVALASFHSALTNINNSEGVGTSSHPSLHNDPEKLARKAKARFAPKPFVPHSCRVCKGRSCKLCNQGCLMHEGQLLMCSGPHCHGAKIRKGAIYFIAKDGISQFCEKCHSNLPAVLPSNNSNNIHATTHSTIVKYKRDLLKRKNDEEMPEEWISCTNAKCGAGVHHICAMHNKFVHDDEKYLCPSCVVSDPSRKACHSESKQSAMYTFLSGSDLPVKLTDILENGSIDPAEITADSLKQTPLTAFIEQKVREQMVSDDCPNAERTTSVRIISECNRVFKVPDVVRRHFRMDIPPTTTDESSSGCEEGSVTPPSSVRYNSKAFALFQKIDGVDVCIFCMYVQEYDGDDEGDVEHEQCTQKKRVYIAYIDSVEHFRPRPCRTAVYREMLVAYLATARARGYESASIWACPPSRGNSFVFWNHPAQQRTPSAERLVSWYDGALSRAINCGVVVDVRSLYEAAFQQYMPTTPNNDNRNVGCTGKMVCPPLLEGDFWIEEAVRIHSVSLARHLKSKSAPNELVLSDPSRQMEPLAVSSNCPAIQLATLLHDRIMAHPKAAAFRRPVNAVALNLKDYHRVITKPMDLGTVYSKCLLGEFEKLSDLVSEVELVFANAMRYNPKGHYVHNIAIEMKTFFFSELNSLTASWPQISKESGVNNMEEGTWLAFADLSTSLNVRLSITQEPKRDHNVGDINQPSAAATTPTSADIPVNTNNTSIDAPIIGATGASSQVSSIKPSLGQHSSVNPSLQNQQSSEPRAPQSQQSPRKSKRQRVTPKLELLTGGPDAVHQRMVGDDVWLMDKKNPAQHKGSFSRKKGLSKRKKSSSVSDLNDENLGKKRRQSWLGEEVGESVRRMRTSFYVCSLVPKEQMSVQEKEKFNEYNSYVASFVAISPNERNQTGVISSRIADARHALLEFSQYRNFEFDSLRHAKYSTTMLLYHLHNARAPGLIPTCTSCDQSIEDVRWHKVMKIVESRPGDGRPGRRRGPKVDSATTKEVPPPALSEQKVCYDELCSACHSKASNPRDFIPVPVSFLP